MHKTLSIIVPCFNEEESIPLFYEAMEDVKKNLPYQFEYIFINDGSKDNSLETIKNLRKQNEAIRYISFSRNFGKEAAIYAGLQNSTGELVTLMDVDLQDPPELLPKMIELLTSKSIDCVGTRRSDRKGEPPIRSFFARQFYKIINKISDTEMVDGARDFRLMTRQMVNAILELSEYNRFSKGIFSWVGFETEYISFENRERQVGETSWSFWKLLDYSINGIVNFSEAPLNIASLIGALSCLFSGIALIFIIIRTIIFGDPTSGWPSMVSIFLFVGGMQLLSLGIIGKYLGKIFTETKKRPIYIVKETEKDK
ncbi:glycosyltransferase family 2 protein [Vagococcus sp. BWB3-3]|uniref:Glycosyltransferase family 2 protein n=1 Tax=Vagococcus allomyrinae TaxID=2794353 RepID=A0A940PFH0_9ENTE|nr:glycosyltransferase family 2 protein [Vagococcus allomyrinae]MBP1043637.1 glycosyltransferase family 2 protein [Vagococcus allomyrinae]